MLTKIMLSKWTLFVFAFFLFASGTDVKGEILYSIDNATDELVQINISSSGGVRLTTVGEIGHDMHRVSMTSLGGLLYAVTSNTPNVFADAGFTIVTIDPDTGEKLSSAPVTSGGADVSIVESLTTFGGELIVGFDVGELTSKRTGILDPVRGFVTNTSPRGPDLDAMATVEGEIIGIDSVDRRRLVFYDVKRDPPSFTLIGDFTDNGTVIDLTYAQGTLYGLEFFNASLFTLSPTPRPEKLSELSLGPAGKNLSGLAFVPEPSSILLAALGLLGLVAFRWRRCLVRQ